MLCRSTEETPLYDLLRLFRDQQNLSSPFVDIVLKFGDYLYLNVKIKSVSPNFDGHSGFIFFSFFSPMIKSLQKKVFRAIDIPIVGQIHRYIFGQTS